MGHLPGLSLGILHCLAHITLYLIFLFFTIFVLFFLFVPLYLSIFFNLAYLIPIMSLRSSDGCVGIYPVTLLACVGMYGLGR
ncbi:hypothetical protein V8F06_002661 [Rhypophila decipiens]